MKKGRESRVPGNDNPSMDNGAIYVTARLLQTTELQNARDSKQIHNTTYSENRILSTMYQLSQLYRLQMFSHGSVNLYRPRCS